MVDNQADKCDKAILFIANRSYLFALGTMIVNILDIKVDFDEIVIINSDFSDDDKNLILSLEKRCRFIDYTIDDFLKEFSIEKLSNKHNRFIKRYSHLTYVKIKIFQLLEYYKRILYMDLDMLIKGGVKELFDLDCDIAWRTGAGFLSKFSRSNLDINKIESLHFVNAKTITPNCGLLFVRDTMDYESVYQLAKGFIKSYIDCFVDSLDELAFSYVFHKKKLRLVQLNRFVYNSFTQWSRRDTKIVHFFGRYEKPWDNILIQSIYPEWIEYYKIFSEKVKISFESVTVYNNLGYDLVAPNIFVRIWRSFLSKPDFMFPSRSVFDFNLSKDTLVFKVHENFQYEIKTFLYNTDRFVVSIRSDKSNYDRYSLEDFSAKYSLNKIAKDNDIILSTDRILRKTAYNIFCEMQNFTKNINILENIAEIKRLDKKLSFYKRCEFFIFWRRKHYQKKQDKIRRLIYKLS